MSVSLRCRNLDHLADLFDMGLGARPTIRMNLNITGPAAAYALVWEWGRVDIKPGPKTVYGMNPYVGDVVVLTKTAPYGYIRINRTKYIQYVRQELGKIVWKNLKPAEIPSKVDWALRKAAERCADLIAETAPFDTGQLRDAIRAVSVTTGQEVEAVNDIMSFRLRVHR